MRGFLNFETSSNQQTRQEIQGNDERLGERERQRRECLGRLVDAGMFKRVSEIDSFHGRNGDGNAWQVDPDFNNAGNASGNRNVNKVAALNVASREVASKFAMARNRQNGGQGRPELYEIAAKDPNALVISNTFDWNFDSNGARRSQTEVAQIRHDLAVICDQETNSTVKFNERGAMQNLTPRDVWNSMGVQPNSCYISGAMAEQAGQNLRISRDMAVNLASTINENLLLQNNPLQAGNLFIVNSSESKRFGLTNPEVFGNWCRANHIVGIEQTVKSATLGEKIDITQFFDLHEVNSTEALEREREARNRRMGKAALKVGRLLGNRERNLAPKGSFRDTLRKTYARPEELIGAAKDSDPLIRSCFESSAGVWEGYSVEDHTEATLRSFDNNFADNIPANLVPLMHLALVTHDIGKSVAVQNGDKKNQDQYNQAYAKYFMDQNHIDTHVRNAVLMMIGDAQKLTSELFVKNNLAADWHLHVHCLNILKELGVEDPDSDDIDGMKALCAMIQTCDSAAYSSLGVVNTHTPGGRYGKVRHRGGNTNFNRAFMRPTDILHQRAKFGFVKRNVAQMPWLEQL